MAKKPPPILIFAVFSFWVALPVFAQSEESASPPPRQTHDDHDRATGPVFRSFPRDSTIMVRSYMPPELDPRHRYPDARPVRDLPGGGKAGTGNSRGRVMTWNLVTGEVSESEEVSLPDLQEILMVPGQAGVLQAPSGGDRDPGKDFNGWYLVEDPTTWEYPRRVKMWMSFRDQSNQVWEFVGSGSLIDPMHVLTAAHCVYAHEDLSEGWSIFDGAEAVTISPGYEVGISPWGLAEAVELHVWSAWIDDEDSNFDLAIVDLDRPVGILTGCYGFGYHPDCDYFLHGVWDLAGYPIWSDPPGELMYEAVGNYDWCSWLMGGGNLVTFDSSAGQGLSGSGSVRDGIIWAVHVARNEYESLDCAICNGIFQDSEGILLADRPTSPDLWPLQVQVEPYLVDPGDQLSSFSFVLGNYSRVGYTGNVICKIYLSADNVITEDDIWLDYVNVEANIPPGTGQSVAIQPPTIPVTTDPGQWFLGLIITLEDADQGNNVTGVFDQGVINVHCPYVPMTVITAPANGEVCQPTSRTIDWNDVPNADIYELVIGPGCDVGLTVPTSVSQYTVTGLNHGQTYFVKVRTHSICGEVSAWSPCIHFTTEYIPSPYFTFTDPPEGDFCQDADSVTVRWDPMPRAYMYQIQLGETCGSGLVSSVTTGSTGRPSEASGSGSTRNTSRSCSTVRKLVASPGRSPRVYTTWASTRCPGFSNRITPVESVTWIDTARIPGRTPAAAPCADVGDATTSRTSGSPAATGATTTSPATSEAASNPSTSPSTLERGASFTSEGVRTVPGFRSRPATTIERWLAAALSSSFPTTRP